MAHVMVFFETNIAGEKKIPPLCTSNNNNAWLFRWFSPSLARATTVPVLDSSNSTYYVVLLV